MTQNGETPKLYNNNNNDSNLVWMKPQPLLMTLVTVPTLELQKELEDLKRANMELKINAFKAEKDAIEMRHKFNSSLLKCSNSLDQLRLENLDLREKLWQQQQQQQQRGFICFQQQQQQQQ